MEEFRELDSYYLVSNKGRIKSKRSIKDIYIKLKQ